GLASFERNQELLVVLRHVGDDFLDERLACLEKLIKTNFPVDHSLEAAFVFCRNLQARGCEDFGHRPVMADQIDDEGFAEFVIDAFVGEQVANIKKIAGMLAIKRGHKLAGVQVWKADHRHLSEAELFFNPRSY